MIINRIDNQPFTVQDSDRLLGLADQFMEGWEQSGGKGNSECAERRIEYDSIRPLWVQAPKLLELLIKARNEIESMSFFLGDDLVSEVDRILAELKIPPCGVAGAALATRT